MTDITDMSQQQMQPQDDQQSQQRLSIGDVVGAVSVQVKHLGDLVSQAITVSMGDTIKVDAVLTDAMRTIGQIDAYADALASIDPSAAESMSPIGDNRFVKSQLTTTPQMSQKDFLAALAAQGGSVGMQPQPSMRAGSQARSGWGDVPAADSMRSQSNPSDPLQSSGSRPEDFEKAEVLTAVSEPEIG